LTLERHKYLGIGVAVAGILLYVAEKAKFRRILANFSSLLLLGLLMGAGHLGGSLTHGSSYLTQALPASIKSQLGIQSEEGETEVQTRPSIAEASAYQAVVAPIFKEKCQTCHGSEKQKGKLRLDSPDALVAGGKNGPVLVAGDADASELMKRILLPTSNDKHMPPKEKAQLSEEEVKLLHWWIQSGADFAKKAADLPTDPAAQSLLDKYGQAATSTGLAQVLIDEHPAVSVKAPDPKVIEQMKAKGLVVLPLGQNQNFLSLNFVNFPKVSAKDFAALAPLQKNIASFKLSDTNIDDAGLAEVAKFPNLTKLFLERTKVSDAGLAKLRPLSHLQYLNLVGTKVSAKGLATLAALPALKQVYLYQTGLQAADFQALQAQMPKVRMDTGGYRVPTLYSDTTLVQPPKVKGFYEE
jgi:mono/diheme cytochrome c family protein